MPFGTKPPELNRNVASLSLREILELGAIATEGVADGISADAKITELIEAPEPKDEEESGDNDDDD